MTKSRVFFILSVSFVVGIFVRSFFEISHNYYFIILIFSVTLLAVFYRNAKIVVIVFALLFFALGAWRVDGKIKQTQYLAHTDETFNSQAVVQKVSPGNFGQNLTIEIKNLTAGKITEKIYLLIQVPTYPEYAYGDLLDVSCLVKPIENLPADQAGKNAEFDYKMYLAKEGVLYSCADKKIQKIAEGRGNIFLNKILKIKKLFENNIFKVIPQPEGALASGLLFGGSSGLSKEIQNDFSRTGMTHIVAVSGYNVTIIAEYLIILGIALGLWRKQAIWFALVGIILFVILVGMPASAVRAGVMGGMLLWAMKYGRLSKAENAVIFAGAIMLFFNPLLLRWDIGFQLSFLATLGIVASSYFWEKSFVKKHKALGISEVIMLSLSAQIFVLPIIAYNFKIVSLVSLLANIFILPIVPLSMLLVFLVSISGFIFLPLSTVLAWLAFVPLKYEISLIHALAQFPWASLQFENVSPWFVIGYYIFLAAGAAYLKRKNKIAKFDSEKIGNDLLLSRLEKGK